MIRIVSTRRENNSVPWIIVHEWEDDFQDLLNKSAILNESNKKSLIRKFRYHEKIFSICPRLNKHDLHIVFHMVSPYEYNYYSEENYIPIIIDAWKPDLERIQKFCRLNKAIFLGSMEAVLELKHRGLTNTHYLPVSISKRYERNEVPVKDIDVIIYGRNHKCLCEWTERLAKKNYITVVQCRPDKNEVFRAWSNKLGALGIINERKQLMDLIGRSKYTVVSSPGNDLEDSFNIYRTGGYSPVTPRFFEAAVNYSVGVGIFPDNYDYAFCHIKDASVYADNFDSFETQICTPLNYSEVKDKMDSFLKNHWSEKRLCELVTQLGNR